MSLINDQKNIFIGLSAKHTIQPVIQRFKLSEDTRKVILKEIPHFGFNGLGEVVFRRTYSRDNESWNDVVIRVIEGVMSIRKEHFNRCSLRWVDNEWQTFAKDMAMSLFKMEWLPPGRGLWMMGTDFTYNRGSMALNNCAATDTTDDIVLSAEWTMDGLMNGVGVGFTTYWRGEATAPDKNDFDNFTIADSREGWIHSLIKLMCSYINSPRYGKNKFPKFDYTHIREAGLKINGFGGLSSGYKPLKKMHTRIEGYLDNFCNGYIKTNGVQKVYNHTRLVADIFNSIGACVVAGNVRRSAEIALGDVENQTFLNLKNYSENPERGEIGWMSNNSVVLQAEHDYNDFSYIPEIAKRIRDNGEPGMINLYNVQKFGRYGKEMKDNATLINPCFSGDTLVAVIDKRCHVSIKKLAEEGKDIPVYSMNPVTNEISIKWGRCPRVTGNNKLLRVHFENNKGYIDVTYNHGFFLNNGKDVKAIELKRGDSIPQFMKSFTNNYSYIWNNGKCVADRHLVSDFRKKYNLLEDYELDIYSDLFEREAFRACLHLGESFNTVEKVCENKNCSVKFNVKWEKRNQSYCSKSCYNNRKGINRFEFKTTKLNSYIVSYVEKLDGMHKVYNITVEDNHTLATLTRIDNKHIMGLFSKNCGEIPLENFELCVGKNTRILTKYGCPKISQCVGKKLPIWNGKDWCTVSPFQTGENKVLYRVNLSDGSYLDVTNQHKWSIYNKQLEKLEMFTTGNLKPGMCLETTEVKTLNTGINIRNSYLWGLFLGGDYIINNSSFKKIHKDPEHDGIEELERNSSSEEQKYGIFHIGDDLCNYKLGLPEFFFEMNSESICNFVAGCIESTGYVMNHCNSEYYVVESDSHAKMLDIQLLLRRVGINFCSVNSIYSQSDNDKTYMLKIPTFECSKIKSCCKTKIVKCLGNRMVQSNRNPSKYIDNADKQYVKSIQQLSGFHDTFCFTEPLEHKGMFNNVLTYQCNLAETFPPRCNDPDRFFKALKFATFYATTVSLLPTHRPETNSVIARNRRIGISISGISQWASGEVSSNWGKMNYTKMTKYLRDGYKIIRSTNNKLSKEAGVPASIRVTTIKPSGSISLLAGVTPGVHYPISRYAIRRMRIGKNSPLVKPLIEANIPHEDDTYSDNTIIFEFVIDHGNVRPCEDVSPWEQFSLVALMQRCYSDNSVSATIYFDKEKDGPDVEKLLAMYIPVLKSVSMLPHSGHGYVQAPYEPITKDVYDQRLSEYTNPTFTSVKGNVPVGSKFCTGVNCEV